MNSQELQAQLQSLLSQSPEEVIAWERDEFDRLSLSPESPLVLFGAGGLGKKTLEGLRQVGIEPLCFVDNNQRLQGETVNGVKVLAPLEAIKQYGTSATFVVTIWGGRSPDRMRERLKFLSDSGCKRVTTFYPLFCKYPDAFLPHYACALPHKVYQEKASVLAAGPLWSDTASRQEFLGQLKWRSQMEFSFFPEPVEHEIYFPNDICSLRSNETFVDCGAFDGDTVRDFLSQSLGSFEKIFAFEPDPENFKLLESWLGNQPADVMNKTKVEQCAIGGSTGVARFSAEGTEASAVGDSGSIEVNMIAIDDYFDKTPITYLKMDIEGAELSAIRGAARTIQRDRPVLAVCVYHQQDHIWTIPNAVNSICKDYRFYLRPHLLEGWDTVLYAVPEERVHESH